MAERKRLIDFSLTELLVIWIKERYERNKKSLEPITLAKATNKAPQKPGVYELYLNDRIVYIGKATGNLNHHFIKLYDGQYLSNPNALLSYEIIFDNRDQLELKWYVMNDETRLLEKELELIQLFKPAWNYYLTKEYIETIQLFNHKKMDSIKIGS
ncbi:hypothetical protein [Haloplasma contractile]|uniref:UvrABC system protein C n=1 Tax=Haloplasma contractile SSD-17B TaxID=1033810 RepID=F7Q1I2_9MOLU|nr:hypothetical protein [Haloplasma contractile]ERJ12909.1 UvrABC system protein C [Haloplasma contractile SSD-17B]